MSKPKEKVVENSSSKPKVSAEELFGKGSEQGETQWRAQLDELTQVWKSETKELLDTQFASYEEALNTLVDRVVTRMRFEGDKSTELKQFLVNLLDSDEDMKRELQALLRIR